MTIPDSVTRIGSVAFRDCRSLKSITFEGNAPSSLGADVFKYLPIGATITVPVGATGFGETFGGLPVIIQKNYKLIPSANPPLHSPSASKVNRGNLHNRSHT